MTAEEIRAETRVNVTGLLADEVHKNMIHPITVMQYGAIMEVAAQLAELNEHIARLTEYGFAVRDVSGEI